MSKGYRYSTGELIKLGDIVEKEGTFFTKPKRGYISYIPGISAPNQYMKNKIGFSYVNMVYGGTDFFVAPEHKVLSETIKFVERSNNAKGYRYSTGEIIQLGDIVEIKGIFFTKPKRGYISYIPGISEPHSEMEDEIGISYVDGGFTSFIVDPLYKVLKESIRFIEHSSSKDFITPDQIAPEDW